MAHHHFKRLKRAMRGVYLHRRGRPIYVELRHTGCYSRDGDAIFQTLVYELWDEAAGRRHTFPGDSRGWQLWEIWEADLWTLRKITCAYLPQMSRYLGSVRSFEWWRPRPQVEGTVTGRLVTIDSHDGVITNLSVSASDFDEVGNLDFSEIEERYLAHLSFDAPGGPVDELVKQMREAGMSVDMEAAAKAAAYCDSPVINNEGTSTICVKPDDWDSKTEREKVEYQLSVDVLVDHFPVFHAMLERVIGRPVFTHEIGPDLLKETNP